MAEHYAIEVSSIEGAVAVLSVRAVHDDAPAIEPSATLAMMLLLDPIDLGRRGAARSPLARITADRAEVDEARWVVAHARGFVRSVRRRGTRQAATLTITVTDPAWLRHLVAGMHWRSASYGAGPGARCPARREGASPAPEPGLSEPGFTECAILDSYAPVRRARVPTLDAERYQPRAPARTLPAMTRLARTLVGQPVVIVFTNLPRKVGVLMSGVEVSTIETSVRGKRVSYQRRELRLYEARGSVWTTSTVVLTNPAGKPVVKELGLAVVAAR